MGTLATIVAARTRRPRGQFGQPSSVGTFGGATACGPTSVQSIVYAFRKVMPTLDAIARAMGYWRPADRRGTTAEQNAKALAKWRLSYRARYGAGIAELAALTRKGPVMLVVRYPKYPAWRGYRGVARPTPWAKPYGKAGANQFPRPDILHWVVWCGTMKTGPYAGLEAVVEPNHDSPARPENVAVDYITRAALSAAYRATPKAIAVVPLRSL